MSNRLTFSLASLIVLIAFGLVFAPTSVMAHDDASGDSSTTPRPHSHPLLETLPKATAAEDITAGRAGMEVLAHGVHPTVTSVMLKANDGVVSGNMAVITEDDSATTDVAENELTLVVTFSQPVNITDGTGLTVDDTQLIAANSFALSVRNANNAILTGSPVVVSGGKDPIARVADNEMAFEVRFAFTADATPNGTADDALESLTFYVQVNAGAAFGLAKPADGLPTNTPGGASYISDANSATDTNEYYAFTLVHELPTPPTAPAAPTGLMADVDHQAGTVELTWTAAADTMYEYSSDGTTWMDATSPQTVTGLTADMDITLMVRVKAAAPVPAGMSASVMVHIDQTAPMVTITAPDDLDTDGMAVFTIAFDGALGTGPSGFQFGDLDITGGTATAADLTMAANFDAAMPAYMLSVTPGPGIVMVSLNADAVADMVGNVVDDTADGAMAEYNNDSTAPTVMISPPAAPDSDGNLTFTFNFSEEVDPATIVLDRAGSDNARLGAGSDPMVNATDATIYTILVEPKNPDVATTVLLLKGSVMDLAGNGLAADADATFTPSKPLGDTVKPTVTIALVDGPYANCDMGNMLDIMASDNDGGSGLATGADGMVAASEVSASAGWAIEDRSGAIWLVPKADGSAIGVTSVTVTVAKDAVKDTATPTANGNDETTAKITVGPVLTIPGGGYILVSHPAHVDPTYPGFSQSHILDPLVLNSLPIRAPEVSIQEWDCMPDLTVLFGRTAPARGGGAIVVKVSPENNNTTNPVGVGSVGITEIMWGSDEGIQHGGFARTDGRLSDTNYAQTREQWIEVHNRNAHPVMVTLFARLTNQALVVESDEIDRVSNYNITTANRNVWEVPGQSGNSEFGTDFVSMQRAQHAGQDYNHNDRKGYKSGVWSASPHSYLTARAGLANTGQLAAENLNYDFRGTPGRSNSLQVDSPPTKTGVRRKVIFNEVANRRDQTLEWIELKNTTDGDIDLRNYEITLVRGVDNEQRLYIFPNADNAVIIKAKGILLLVDTDPRYNDDHPVAVGYNVRGGNDQALGLPADAPRYAVTNFAEGGLPDDGNFVMILRHSKGDEGYDNKKNTGGHVEDLVGWHSNLAKGGHPLYTNLWPLTLFNAPNKGRNKMEVETVHYRRHPGQNPDAGDNNKPEQIALNNAGYTGVGYKRFASRHNPGEFGTPGYDHAGLIKNLASEVGGMGVVTISEIMLDQGDSRYPQWIELYNSSDSPVNLHHEAGWRLVIENFDDGEIPVNRLNGTLNFKSSDVQTILPKQTVLVASTRARSSGSAFFDTGVIFPPSRVFSVWDDARGALDMKRTTDPILSTQGFYIELIDGKNNVADSVGNLIDSPNRRVAAEIAWPLTDITGEMMEGEPRSSILRRYREPKGGDARNWVPYTADKLMDMGITADGWVLASMTDFREVRQTWYGHGDDIGSPGITGGRVLPVELSKFRPERLDDGSVAIRWITESEKDNAGFNILRSEDRHGEFEKLNTQLIAGKGTTSERTLYEFVDKSAKPNVVYYYQIQDVSLDGDVEILQITHLRGQVSAAGKAATTWGDIKALQ